MTTKLEAGHYSRFEIGKGKVVEVFHVDQIGGHEADALTPGKWYYGNQPVGPYDTEAEALTAAKAQ